MNENVIQLRPEAEAYLTRRELAARLRVGLTTLDKWVAEGMPSYTWGMRLRRFRLSECERWLRDRGRNAA